MKTLLQLKGVDTYYGEIHILQQLTLDVGEGELVCLLGGNASGKSTTLKTILGIVRPRNGRVEFDGEDVTGQKTSYRIAQGMAIVPENRRLFAPMTVMENLEMGAYLQGGAKEDQLERVYGLFPLLKERRKQLAGTLSGGEQQMVAMGRALMSDPKLLLMDEPSMGLAPILVERNFEIIKQVHEAGVAVLVVEQNANVSLSIADRGYVLQTGRIVLADQAKALLANEGLRKAYLGRGKEEARLPQDRGVSQRGSLTPATTLPGNRVAPPDADASIEAGEMFVARQGHGFEPRVDAERLHQVADVISHGLPAQMQFLGDLHSRAAVPK